MTQFPMLCHPIHMQKDEIKRGSWFSTCGGESKRTSNYSWQYIHNAICESLQAACKAKVQMLRGKASIATKKNVPLHVGELDSPPRPPPKKKSWAEFCEVLQYTQDQRTDLMQQVYWSTLVTAVIEPVWKRLPWFFQPQCHIEIHHHFEQKSTNHMPVLAHVKENCSVLTKP